MNAKILISNSFDGRAGLGGVRAEKGADGSWTSEVIFAQQDVRCLAADPVGRETVWAGTQGNGVLKSTDAGRTWSMAGLDGKIVKAVAVSPHDPNHVFAGTKPALLYVTRDGGQSWHELDGFRRIPWRWLWFSPAEPPFYQAYVHAISISPTDPNVILAGMEYGAVVRSDDGGATWSRHRRGALRDCHGMTFHPRDGQWVYEAGAGRGPGAVSRDGGLSWRQPREGAVNAYGWACAADPEQPEVWYVSASTGPGDAHSLDHARAHIYRWTGGAGWKRLGGGLPQPLDALAVSLVSSHEQPGQLYAGLSNGEVWFTEDHGDQWRKLEVDLRGIWHQLIVL